VEDLKDIVFIVTVIVSLVASYYALKYKTEGNHTKLTEDEKSFEKFKEFAYKELKGIDEQISTMNINLQNMLTKKEAEDRYITKKELELTIKNIDFQFNTIKDLLDDIKRGLNA
jgi:predicted transcriptional regulator